MLKLNRPEERAVVVPPSRTIAHGVLVPVASVLLAASWLEAKLYVGAWLGFALFFWLAAVYKPSRMLVAGGLIGMGMAALAFHWVPGMIAETWDVPSGVSWLIFAGFLAWEAIPFAIVGWLAARNLRAGVTRLWIVPFVWVVLEHYWPTMVPWSVAQSQTGFLTLLQVAELTGASGISGLLISVALVPVTLRQIALRVHARSLRRALGLYAIGTCGLLTAALGLGIQRFRDWERQSAAPAVRMALVQVDPEQPDSQSKMRQLASTLTDNVDLICLPHSSLGTYPLAGNAMQDEAVTEQGHDESLHALRFPREGDVEVLAGGRSGLTIEDESALPTAFLIRPEGTISGRYLSVTSRPVADYFRGEHALYHSLALLRSWLGDAEDRSEMAPSGPLLMKDGTKIGALLGRDETQSRIVRRHARDGAELLVSLVDSQSSAGGVVRDQRMRLSLLRAVEHRRYVARCSGAGESCIIAADGRLLEQAEAGTETVLRAALPRLTQLTVFTRFGNWLPLLGVMLCIGALLPLRLPHPQVLHRKTLHRHGRKIRPSSARCMKSGYVSRGERSRQRRAHDLPTQEESSSPENQH